MKNIKYIAIMALGLVACEPELDNSVEDAGFYSSGDADLSRFVSVGNSLTAGFTDGTVFAQGQKHSFPNILAGQFAKAGGGTFRQPLVNGNVGGLLLNGAVSDLASNRFVLAENEFGIVGPTSIEGTPSTEISNRLTGSFNNMGVPSVKSYEVEEAGFGALSNVDTFTAPAWYSRFASSDTSSILDDAMAQDPTFFTFWIGSNDVLLYALDGGAGVDQLGNSNTDSYGQEDLTDPTVFANAYTAALTKMTDSGAKGIVCNLPSVTDIPYFNFIAYNPIPLDQATADLLNAGYAVYNDGLDVAVMFLGLDPAEAASRKVVFTAGLNNRIVIEDEYLTDLSGFAIPSYRMTTATDMVLLSAGSILGTEVVPGNPLLIWGASAPLTDEYILTPQEQTLVADAQAAYNATISAAAAANDNVILVDMQAFLNQLNNGGMAFDAGIVTSTYASGGGFSLDGTHPTARGYALIANIMIDEINNSFNATIPKVNPAYYPTVYID